MKAILMSIKPKYVSLILNGTKTIEIRKRFPSDYRGWVYIYCTKDRNGELHYSKQYGAFYDVYGGPERYSENGNLNGKVVACFWCDQIDKRHIFPTENVMPFNPNVESQLNQLCLTKQEVMDYGHGDDYYAQLIHISKLKIFDQPLELYNFKTKKKIKGCTQCMYPIDTIPNRMCKDCYWITPLFNAPQSWQYIEIEEIED